MPVVLYIVSVCEYEAHCEHVEVIAHITIMIHIFNRNIERKKKSKGFKNFCQLEMVIIRSFNSIILSKNTQSAPNILKLRGKKWPETFLRLKSNKTKYP